MSCGWDVHGVPASGGEGGKEGRGKEGRDTGHGTNAFLCCFFKVCSCQRYHHLTLYRRARHSFDLFISSPSLSLSYSGFHSRIENISCSCLFLILFLFLFPTHQVIGSLWAFPPPIPNITQTFLGQTCHISPWPFLISHHYHTLDIYPENTLIYPLLESARRQIGHRVERRESNTRSL